MQHTSKKQDDESEVVAMAGSFAILIGGFFIVAFVSGPAGLIVSLAALSFLGAFYAFKS